MVVDTDVAVPKLVARVRVDVFTDDGTWLTSGDFPARNPDDWPLSFSLFLEEETGSRDALVRIRGYADGKLRDYRGERALAPIDPGDPKAFVDELDGDGLPRLVQDGVDVTPTTEPIPTLAIDRLVRVHLEDGVRGTVPVVLRGACLGTRVDLAGRRTCDDQEQTLVSAPTVHATKWSLPPKTSDRIGEIGAPLPCARAPRRATTSPSGVPLFDDEVCVPGGAFFLGSALSVESDERIEEDPGVSPNRLSGLPERAVVMPPLLVDRHEVTVARWRAALERGFVPPEGTPEVNDGPIPDRIGTNYIELCTFSTAPMGRETHPLSCVKWDDARAFCQFHGGDLPTEAQWEYFATLAPDRENPYAWGVEPPTCDHAVYGRAQIGSSFSFECIDHGFGPQPLEAQTPLGETPAGLRGVNGSLAEWVVDSYLSYSTACWATASVIDPRCAAPSPSHYAIRGGAWIDDSADLLLTDRSGVTFDFRAAHIGFRCVRPGTVP